MLAHQRHDEILRQVNENGSVRVTDLVAQLGVSEMTVRRDIRVLAARGLLERVHGGAVKVERDEQPGKSTVTVSSEEQKALAQAALETIRPGSAVFIGAGGCARSLAKLIIDSEIFSSLTVITNFLPVAKLLDQAQQLQRDQGIAPAQVIIFGGQPDGYETLGPLTLVDAHNFHIHSVFIEAEGLDAETGLSCQSLDRAALNRILIRKSEFATAIVPSGAWQRSALNIVCPIDKLSRVIAGSEPPSEIASVMKQAQIMVDVCEP